MFDKDELGVHLGAEKRLRTRMFIRDNWRLTVWQGMVGGKLNDRDAVPHGMHNLWFDSNFAARKAEMTEAMPREMIRLSNAASYATHIA